MNKRLNMNRNFIEGCYYLKIFNLPRNTILRALSSLYSFSLYPHMFDD